MRLVQEEHQEHKEQQVHLTLQQVSRLAAGLIITAFFVFIAGFYWGKKSVTEAALEETTERLLTDKIYAALYRAQDSVQKTTEQEAEQEQAKEHIIYSLHLGMFTTRKAAQACLEKLKELDSPAHVQQRASTTAQGKQHIWYEVITSAYTTHAEVEALQERIEKKITQQTRTRIIAQKER